MQIMQQSLYHILNEIYKRSKFLKKEDFDFFLSFSKIFMLRKHIRIKKV